jgi:N-acylneuraminate cytidylyltransferase
MNIIALIPAREKSKRIPNKNIKNFFGHPLIAYAIDQAIKAEIFNGIYVSSDSEEIGKIAEYYGAKFIKRPDKYATDISPDAEWIEHALQYCLACDAFMILRPTSPFRMAETIKRAWKEWDKTHCMKAIEKVKQHPDKMWKILSYNLMWAMGIPGAHLQPIQNLEEIYIQNGSLEIRPIQIANGREIHYQPFFTENYEGFDLNFPEDWILAEALVERGLAKVPWIIKENHWRESYAKITL